MLGVQDASPRTGASAARVHERAQRSFTAYYPAAQARNMRTRVPDYWYVIVCTSSMRYSSREQKKNAPQAVCAGQHQDTHVASMRWMYFKLS